MCCTHIRTLYGTHRFAPRALLEAHDRAKVRSVCRDAGLEEEEGVAGGEVVYRKQLGTSSKFSLRLTA